MNIYDQLQAVEDRYKNRRIAITALIMLAIQNALRLCLKKRETVTVYREYKQILQNIEDAEEMIKDAGGDPELEEMAKEELKDSKAAKEDYEEKLKILLLAKTK